MTIQQKVLKQEVNFFFFLIKNHNFFKKLKKNKSSSSINKKLEIKNKEIGDQNEISN